MNNGTRTAIPSSGEVLGFLTDHLGLRSEVGTDKTTQRVFRGERVSPESIREVVTSLVSVLWPAGFGAELQPAVVDHAMVALGEWDARRSRLYVELRPEEPALVFLPFMRLLALELGLRLGAIAWMTNRPQPSPEDPPTWFHDDGFGRELDVLLSRTKTLRSRAMLADLAKVTANTMSAWSRCEAFPSEENIERLSIELADGIGAPLDEILRGLRLQLLACWGRKRLVEEVGVEVADDLLRGALWCASHIWRLAKQQSAPRDHPLLAELVHLGARSQLGSEATLLLQLHAPNALMQADLAALPFDWTPRLRAWIPLMLSTESDALDARRFFPAAAPDPEKAAAAIAAASEGSRCSAAAFNLMSSGQMAEAAHLWERATQLEPEVASHHYNFAMAHFRAHGPSREVIERSLMECRIAFGLADDHVEARIDACDFLVDLGRFEEASSAYEEARRKAPSSARLEFNWGHMLMTLGRDVEAAEHFEAATRLQPMYVDAWSNLCFVLERSGRKREARAAARRAEFLGHPAARMSLDDEL